LLIQMIKNYKNFRVKKAKGQWIQLNGFDDISNCYKILIDVLQHFRWSWSLHCKLLQKRFGSHSRSFNRHWYIQSFVIVSLSNEWKLNLLYFIQTTLFLE
jgi:hypothetical protein